MLHRHSAVIVLALTLGLLCIANASAADVQPVNRDFHVIDCGTPVKLLKLAAATAYRHPETGRIHLLTDFSNNNGYGIGEEDAPDSGHLFVDINLDTGEQRRAKGAVPGSLTSNHYLHADGKIYVVEGKTDPSSIAEFDPRTGAYKRLCALTGSISSVRLGASGRIYFGYVGGHASVYDPATGASREFLKLTGKEIRWGVYTMEVDEPWVYCGVTAVDKWWLNILNAETGEAKNYFQDVPTKGSGVSRTEAGRIIYEHAREQYLLEDGTFTLLAERDTSKRLDRRWRPWPNMWGVVGYAGRRFEDAAEVGLEFDCSDAEPDNWNGGRSLIRWRKQGEADWRTIEITGLELVGSAPKCLGVAPDGTLVGVGQFYGPVFRLDPETRESVRIGNCPGSVYSILPLADRTYMGGYVSFLAEWNHDAPYEMHRDQSWEKDLNPKRYRVRAKVASVLLKGPHGRIYAAGKYGRHHPGGGMTVFDPKTKETTHYREPQFELLAPTGLALLPDNRTLIITTMPIGEKEPAPSSVFLFDTETQAFTREIPFDLGKQPDQVFVAGENTVIGVSRAAEHDDQDEQPAVLVYGLDLDAGKTLFEKRHPGRAFTGLHDNDRTPVVRGPDGCGWLFVDEKLCRIQPDGELETVRDKFEYRGKMIWHGNTLYIYNGGRVYQRLFANVVRIPDLFAR